MPAKPPQYRKDEQEKKADSSERALSKGMGLKLLMGLLLALYSWALWLMVKITLQYLPIQTDVAFLSIKQDYVPFLHYRLAFFVHVFSSLFVLPALYTQFSRKLRTRYKQWHKNMGWLYVIVTVFLAGPTGFIIGLYANGGLSSRLAFCSLAILWEVFTLLAMLRILQKNVRAHEKWMIRSYSLALSAITLRAWKYVLVILFHPKPMDVYRIVAWLGWVLNLVIAELIIWKKFKR